MRENPESRELLTAFVDESYREAGWYFLSAFVMTQRAEELLSDALNSVLEGAEELGIRPDAEFHGYDIFHGEGDWRPLRGQIRRAVQIYSDAMQAIVASGAVVFYSAVHSGQLVRRYGDFAFHPYEVAMHNLLTKLDEHFSRRAVTIRVVADKVQEQALREQRMAHFKANGTMGYNPRTLECILFPFEWASSSIYRGLQASDMLLFIHQREFNMKAEGKNFHKELVKLAAEARRIMRGQRFWKP